MNKLFDHFKDDYLWVLVIIIIAAAMAVNKFLRLAMAKSFHLASQKLKTDVTQYAFLKNAVTFIIFLTTTGVLIYTVPALRKLSLTLFASAGIFAAIIGFASQQAFSNIISGIFIVIFKPFRVGDLIRLDQNTTGTVEDITLRHTVIRNFENRRVIIPNSMISSQTIVNSTILESKTCELAEFGISYGSDMDKAIQIIREEAEKHPDLIDTRSEEDIENGVPKVIIRVLRWDESAVILRASLWATESRFAFFLKCDLYYSVKKRFDAEGIEIPFPHRTLYIREGREHLAKKNETAQK